MRAYIISIGYTHFSVNKHDLAPLLDIMERMQRVKFQGDGSFRIKDNKAIFEDVQLAELFVEDEQGTLDEAAHQLAEHEVALPVMSDPDEMPF